MRIPNNKNRPEVPDLGFPVINLFEAVEDNDGDLDINFHYWTPQSLINQLAQCNFEIEFISGQSKNPNKTLPTFQIKCRGQNIGGGFENKGESKYKYKAKISLQDPSKAPLFPDGLLKMMNYVKPGVTPSGQPFKPGCGLYFYEHPKKTGFEIKILRDDYVNIFQDKQEPQYKQDKEDDFNF